MVLHLRGNGNGRITAERVENLPDNEVSGSSGLPRCASLSILEKGSAGSF